MLNHSSPVASFGKEVDRRLAKRPLKTNGHLASRRLASFVKEPQEDILYVIGEYILSI